MARWIENKIEKQKTRFEWNRLWDRDREKGVIYKRKNKTKNDKK